MVCAAWCELTCSRPTRHHPGPFLHSSRAGLASESLLATSESAGQLS